MKASEFLDQLSTDGLVEWDRLLELGHSIPAAMTALDPGAEYFAEGEIFRLEDFSTHIPIIPEDIEALSSLSDLRAIWMCLGFLGRDCQFSYLAPLKNLTKLEVVEISINDGLKNDPTTVPFSWLSTMRNVRRLTIDCGPYTLPPETWKIVGQCTSLRVLNLSLNKRICFKHLLSLSNLEVLGLGYTGLQDQDLAELIMHLPVLKTLDIGSNKITEEGFKTLSQGNLQSLRYFGPGNDDTIIALRANGCQVHCNDREYIFNTFPKENCQQAFPSRLPGLPRQLPYVKEA